jgi:nucleoside-diphosphate-sugar epimerase
MATKTSASAYTLVTGANGEFGHGLIKKLHASGNHTVIALDLHELDSDLKQLCAKSYAGDILEKKLLDHIFASYDINQIYHLAALLSTSAERAPETACEVNVTGTISLLQHAMNQARTSKRRVKFLFPSSIAVYGLPDIETKHSAGMITEEQFLDPATMYGCNKLACEHLGKYYTFHYKQLDKDCNCLTSGVDFRCIRFPGVISAFTVPTGGTSDFAPEMIHAAAKNEPYACFVRENATIPFITMPDAIDALVTLGDAEESALSRRVYNISGFSPSAAEIADYVIKAFPAARITFEPDFARQGIVDTWPVDVDDTNARTDWGYAPKYTVETAFSDYLVPNITAYYTQ